MIDNRLKSEITQLLLRDLLRKFNHRVYPGSLTFVFHQIESL